jgi:hypothetical protein
MLVGPWGRARTRVGSDSSRTILLPAAARRLCASADQHPGIRRRAAELLSGRLHLSDGSTHRGGRGLLLPWQQRPARFRARKLIADAINIIVVIEPRPD